MKSRKKRLREVYVWELPVRIYHWVNALCIVILCITGFIIADPPAMPLEISATEDPEWEEYSEMRANTYIDPDGE